MASSHIYIFQLHQVASWHSFPPLITLSYVISGLEIMTPNQSLDKGITDFT